MERFDLLAWDARMELYSKGKYIRYESHQQSLRDLWGRIVENKWDYLGQDIVKISDIKSAFLSAGLSEEELQ